MSTYRKEWGCCGSVTETDAWEPDECPFCERPAQAVQVPVGMVLVSKETAEGAADWLREYAAELRGRHCVSEGVWGPYRIDMQAKAGHAAMLELAYQLAPTATKAADDTANH